MKTRRSDEKVRTGKKAALISLIIYAAVLLLVPACAAEASAPGLSVRMNGSEAYDEFCRGLLRAAAEDADDKTLLFAVSEKGGVITDIKRGIYNPEKHSSEIELMIDNPGDISDIRIFMWQSGGTMLPLCESVTLYPGGGKAAGQRIYCNENFQDLALDKHISRKAKSNTEIFNRSNLTVVTAGKEDYNFDVTLGDASGRIILQADVAAADADVPGDVRLFHLTGASPDGNEEKHGYGKISNNKLWGRLLTEDPMRFAIAINLEKKTYDVYIDGELYRQNVALGYDYSALKKWKIWIPSGTVGKLVLDNVCAYDGEIPYDIREESSADFSVFNDCEGLSALYGKRAVSPWADAIFYDGVKHKTDKPCRITGDEALISQRSFEKLFNVSTALNGDSISVDGETEMHVGSKTLTVGGKTSAMAAAPEIIDGTLYLPARSYGMAVLGAERFIDDSHGLFIVNDNSLNIPEANLEEANLYMFFRRRTSTSLGRMISENAGGDMNRHPRLMLGAEDVEALKYAVAHDSVKKEWFEKIKSKADEYLTKEPLTYEIANGRLLNTANEALERTSVLGFTYLMTGSKEYGNRAIEETAAVCSFADWHPGHFLDTGTMAQAAAIGYDWAYDCMTAEQSAEIARQAFILGLAPAREQYYGEKKYGFNWHKTDTNWGIVVNSGIMNLALAICEYETDKALDIASEALRSMEYTIYHIAPDGAWHEGASYWRYSSKSLALAFSGFEEATGITHEAVFFKGMNGYADFSSYLLGPDYQAYNFGDSSGGAITSYIQSYIAAAADDAAMMSSRLALLQITGGATVFDIIWCSTDQTEENGLALDAYYRETEFISMRERWNNNKNDNTALWLAAHGGSASAAHSHIDAGSFVFNLGGVRWAVDLGKEDYSYAADDPSVGTALGKFYYYRRKGEGHNLVVINPGDGLETDKDAFAEFTAPQESALGAFSTVELSKNYAENADEYTRGFLLGDNRRSLTVRDEISLKHAGSELYWFMHTKGKITIVNNNTALIKQNNKTLKVEFLTDAESFTLKAMEAKRLDGSDAIPETENTGVRKLAMHITGASGDIAITAKMSMLNESVSEISNISIADWN